MLMVTKVTHRTGPNEPVDQGQVILARSGFGFSLFVQQFGGSFDLPLVQSADGERVG